MIDLESLSTELMTALGRRELHAVYQPQIELVDGRIAAVEALCRWMRPLGDSVGPEVFIPLAEQSGVIHELGMFMLDECVKIRSEFESEGHPIDVSVNVSPTQLDRDSFVDYLIAQSSLGLPAGCALTIEITEAMPVYDIGAVVRRLEDIRSAGIGVSLDDFGVGHASLSRLRVLPLTEVKLDRSLIQSGSRKAARKLREAVDRAREIGLRVVAEGVETAEHLHRARELGCDRAQGYLFAAPMAARGVHTALSA